MSAQRGGGGGRLQLGRRRRRVLERHSWRGKLFADSRCRWASSDPVCDSAGPLSCDELDLWGNLQPQLQRRERAVQPHGAGARQPHHA